MFKFNPTTGKLDLVGSATATDNSLTGIINPAEDLIIESNLKSSFTPKFYFVYIYNSAQNKYKNFSVIVNSDSTTVRDQVFNKIGDSINLQVNNIVNGLNIDFKIKNNEVFELNYKIIKIAN